MDIGRKSAGKAVCAWVGRVLGLHWEYGSWGWGALECGGVHARVWHTEEMSGFSLFSGARFSAPFKVNGKTGDGYRGGMAILAGNGWTYEYTFAL